MFSSYISHTSFNKVMGMVYVLGNALLFIHLNEWHKQSTQYRGVVLKCLQVLVSAPTTNSILTVAKLQN